MLLLKDVGQMWAEIQEVLLKPDAESTFPERAVGAFRLPSSAQVKILRDYTPNSDMQSEKI